MPGTIQVSVLDLMGLPSSSMSVKVSMGKREHQILDKGEFSFPLITLRENLIVTLYDSDGNELSQTGVNTKLVVEKGFWDDLFPLQGGGHLHMKLQFILSEEERRRIREMRESALRKKQQELLSNGQRSLETAAVDIVGLGTEAAFNHEVTDKRESVVQREAVSITARTLHGQPLSSLASPKNYPELNLQNREEVRLEHTSLDKPDGRQMTPTEAKPLLEHDVLRPTDNSSRLHEVHLTEATERTMKKLDSQLLPDVPASPIFSKGAFGYSKTPISNVIIGSEGATSAPIPSQEHKDLYFAEETQQIQNVRDREGASSETTQHLLAMNKTLPPPNNITTKDSSLQNQTHSIIRQISAEKLLKNNETDGGGVSSEATLLMPSKIDIQSPAYNITTMATSSDDQNYSTTKQIALKRTPMNNDINREGSSSVNKLPQALEVFNHTKTTEKLKEKSDIRSPPTVGPTRSIFSKEALGSSTFSADEKTVSTSSPLPENQMHSTGRQTAFGRTPSNVRKMISALESSSIQGKPSHTNAPELKPHLRKVKSEIALKGPSINEAKKENAEKEKQFVEREFNLYSIRKPLDVDVLQNVPNRAKTEVPLKGPRIHGAMMENSEVKKEVIQRELNPFSGRKPLEVTVESGHTHTVQQTLGAADRLPISQTSGRLHLLNARPAAVQGTNSGEQVNCHTRPEIVNLDRKETLLAEFVVASGAETAIMSEDMHTLHYEQQGEQSLEVMGSWTLPDARRRMCITTASKQIMKFVGFDSCGENNQRENSLPRIEGVKEVPVDSSISLKVNESGTTSHNLRKLKTEKSKEDSVPGGFIGQAVRVAIMVAFGTLVIVTRQTKNR